MGQKQQKKGGGESKKGKKSRAKRSPRLTLDNKIDRLGTQFRAAEAKIELIKRRLAAGKPVRGEARYRRRHGVDGLGAFRLRRAQAQSRRLDAHVVLCEKRAKKLEDRAVTIRS